MSFDVAWSPNCTDGRCYDAVGLSKVTDFLVIMAYDERSQIYGPCIASANSAAFTTTAGVRSYLDLGIAAEQLVLGQPWYGYDYPCLNLSKEGVCTIKPVPFRRAYCSDAAGGWSQWVWFEGVMARISPMGRACHEACALFARPNYSVPQVGGVSGCGLRIVCHRWVEYVRFCCGHCRY